MRRPSAALVVASAALVMSTIGTSVAATHYVISSPRVYSAGVDLAPGFPSVSTVIVATTSEAAAGAPAATTFYVAVFC